MFNIWPLHIILHEMATIGGFKEKNRKNACLARGKKLMVAFLVLLGSPVCGWWRQQRWRHGKERGRKPTERRKIETRGKADFSPTLASNFFMLNA